MTTDLTCARLADHLKAYADGQLKGRMRRLVERHLSTCAACREEVAIMQRISQELRAGERDVLEAGLRARLLAAVPQGKEGVAPPARPFWKRPPLLIWGATAGAVVLWVVFVPLMRSRLPSAMDEKQVASTETLSSKSMGMAAMPYTQDYDEAAPRAAMHGSYVAVPATPPAASGATVSPGPMLERQTRMPAAKSQAQALLGKGINGNASIPDIQFKKLPARVSSKVVMTPLDRADADGMPAERQVHKEATLTVEVAQVEPKSEEVERYTTMVGGFVANNQLNTDEANLKTATLTLKIPVARFDATLTTLARLGDVKAKTVSGEDITEKVSDQEQIENTLKDEVNVTREKLRARSTRREAIEDRETLRQLKIRQAQTQARLVMLRKLGALSTVTITLTEKPKPIPPQPTGGFLTDMGDTLHDAMLSLRQAARLPVLTLIWIVAYAPIWLLLLLGYRYAIRR